MSVDPLADLASPRYSSVRRIPITYRPRLGEPTVVQAVQVRPPPALDALGGGRVAHDGLIARIGAADLSHPPAEGDQAIIDQRRYRVPLSALGEHRPAGLGNRGGAGMMIQALVEGELGHFLNAQGKAVDIGGGKAMRIITGAIRKKIAGNIRRAGFCDSGIGLARTVRSRVAGKGDGRRGRRLLEGDL